MVTKTFNPKDIAFWRLDRIEDVVEENLPRDVRSQMIEELSNTPVLWPSGITDSISIATIYRWRKDFLKGGLAALMPRPRNDRGKPRIQLPVIVIQEALRLLTEDPHMSLTFLLSVLKATPTLKGIRVPRSTLARRLAKEPSYNRLKRSAKRTRQRKRFVAKGPHHIWQCDSKGPFDVKLSSGDVLRVHVVTILDDASRSVLAVIVTTRLSAAEAILVFRMAVLLFGLPLLLYADRGSIFMTKEFRMGVALLGTHRIRVLPRNPEVRGKIEAYHRTLVLWFVDRLPHQVVVDLLHLQQLLEGIIAAVYQEHKHRSLKMSPQQALANSISPRHIPPSQLIDVFRQEKRLKAHGKTGEVVIQRTTYLVPDHLRGQRLTFLIDLPAQVPPRVVDPQSGRHLDIQKAAIRCEDLVAVDEQQPIRYGAGPLQTIYDDWSGKPHPQAEAGFGLPEIYALLTTAAERQVPKTDAEASLIGRMYRKMGPLPRLATEQAMKAIIAELGPRRPVKTYLEALMRRVQQKAPSHKT